VLHHPHVAPSGDLGQNAAMAEAPRVPLRRRLLLLAAAGLVPVVIMSGVGLYALGILNVITRPRAPRDWIISIFDANGLRVARSRSHAETLGGPDRQGGLGRVSE
jgi:hypothetical protein